MNNQQAERFIRACARYLGLGFHPDTPFGEYVRGSYNTYTFTLDAAERHDRRMTAAMSVLGDKVYDIGLDEWKKLGLYQP